MQQTHARGAYEPPSVQDLGNLAEFTLGGLKNGPDNQSGGMGGSSHN